MKVLVLELEDIFLRFVGAIGEAEYFFCNPIDQRRVTELLDVVDWVISLSYEDVCINDVICLAKSKKVNTVLLVDGVLEWSNTYQNPRNRGVLYQPIIHDYVGCCMPDQVPRIKKWNPSAEVFLYRNYRLAPDCVKRSVHEERYDFLITTAVTPYFNDDEQKRLTDSLNTIIRIIEEERYSYCLRIFDEKLLSSLEFNHGINIKSSPFQTLLSEVKCVISTPSSICVEAMSAGKPTAQIMYRDSPLFFQTGWLILGQCTLTNTFGDMMNRNKDRMLFQNEEVQFLNEAPDLECVLVRGNIAIFPKLSQREVLYPSPYDKLIENYERMLRSPWNLNPLFFLYRIKAALQKIKWKYYG